MKKPIFFAIFAVMLCAFVFSGYKVYSARNVYGAEERTHRELLNLAPPEIAEMGGAPASGAGDMVESSPPGSGVSAGQSSGADNGWLSELTAINPDTVGWLVIPNTQVDYPFVMSKDNSDYLHEDIHGDSSASGTIFMDCACARDFSGFNTIIYGHHMNNGSMFGTIKYFEDKPFFDANRTGTIYLPGRTLTLEIFAFMTVKPDDETIYGTAGADNAQEYLAYVKKHAELYRNIELSSSDRIVTLSTCSYAFNDARMVLIAKVANWKLDKNEPRT